MLNAYLKLSRNYLIIAKWVQKVFFKLEDSFIKLNSKPNICSIALNIFKEHVNDDKLKIPLTETLFTEIRNWREGGEATWQNFRAVVQTLIVIGIKDNINIKGSLQTDLSWSGNG